MKHTYVDRFGRVVEEHEAIDGRGIIKDGYRLSVALTMKDATRTTSDAPTGFAGRSREALLQDQANASRKDELMRKAYADYDAMNMNAWKNPAGTLDAAPPASEGDECTINGEDGVLVQSDEGALVCRPHSQEDSRRSTDAIKQQAYADYDQELTNAWRNPTGLVR